MSETDKSKSFVTTTDEVIEERDPYLALATEYGVDNCKLMWKIDLCVVPPFCLLQFLSFLDRVNISNANVYGLSESLGLKGNQYNIALTAFFVPYILFEVASNYAIKFVRPHVWLCAIIVSFGAVSIGMGFVHSFGALVACRFLVGVAESGTSPLIVYLLSNYYTKAESQRRFLAFFSVTTIAGAASGAIAYRVNELDGRAGLESWRWLFIIEGVVTCICAVILFFTIADFPEEAQFLNPNERAFLKRKLEIANGSPSAFEVKNTIWEVVCCFNDILIWLPAILYLGIIVPAYGYAYFAATIIKDMGYTAVTAQAYLVYPWLSAFGLMVVVAIALERSQKRLPFVLGMCLLGIAGIAMVLGAPNRPRIRYAGCFLSASGVFGSTPLMLCWHALNMGSHLRKSVGIAWQVGFGTIGGIIATFIFLQKDSPRYITGLAVLIAMLVVAMVLAVLYFLMLRHYNHLKKDPKYQAKFASMSIRDQLNAGDMKPSFVYMY